MSKTVIIGGVAGGATAAARLRRLDEDMEIVIIEKGNYISYANCGLPYYIGGVIKNRDALLVQTPESMRGRYDLDVRTRQQAFQIDPEAKVVQIKKADGTIYAESYDQLIIATGSSPYKPNIPGINSEGIYTLWTVNDTDAIYQRLEKDRPKKVTVIGGGFIGLEMAENLSKRGLDVTLVEATSQVMPPLDMDMAGFLHEHISKKGVHLYTGAAVTGFEKNKKGLSIFLSNGSEIQADMVLLSIGVRPNSKIAREAGLLLGERGGIKVDEYMRTSEPDIWAVGDVAEITNLVTGKPAMIPLAGPANKQGRIAANDICHLNEQEETYDGSLGTSVVKIFDLTAAAVGLNEKALKAEGNVKGGDYEVALIHQKSHASYYPGATSMIIKLIFEQNPFTPVDVERRQNLVGLLLFEIAVGLKHEPVGGEDARRTGRNAQALRRNQPDRAQSPVFIRRKHLEESGDPGEFLAELGRGVPRQRRHADILVVGGLEPVQREFISAVHVVGQRRDEVIDGVVQRFVKKFRVRDGRERILIVA